MGSDAKGILTIFTELTIEMNSVGPVMGTNGIIESGQCCDLALH